MRDDPISRDLVDHPYPLLRNFALYVLPLTLIAIVGLSYSFRETIASGIEAFYAERELNNATFVIHTAYATDPGQWHAAGTGLPDALGQKLTSELPERDITCLIILRPDGKVVYSGTTGDVCNVPDIELFAEMQERGRPELHENLAHDGHWTSLMVVPDPATSTPLLVMASRPSNSLEMAVGTVSNPRMWVFGGVFLAACFAAFWLIFHAQKRLDASFAALNRARIAMEPFLSKSARESVLLGRPSAAKHDAVVMFADLRNFSGFAESAPIEDTANLVDRFVSVSTEAIERHGGDVDKHLGDGVLAWFQGADANIRALKASIECIQGCVGLARRPGIGLFHGEVFASTLGSGDRMDFTILGRSVNLASRLCSAAGVDEVAVPATFQGAESLGLVVVAEEDLYFKNHTTPILTRRYKLSASE